MRLEPNVCLVCDNRHVVTDKEAGQYLSLPQSIHVLKCNDCGLRWLSPMKTPEECDQMYKTAYYEEMPEDYEALAAQRIKHFHERLKTIAKRMKTTRFSLLDVGAATGEFVNEAGKMGIDALGVEPSQHACKEAEAKYKLNLIRGNFLDSDLGEKQFDVIHMNHIFEHLPDPAGSIEKLRTILRDNGLLVIEVPNQFNNVLYLIMKAIRRLKPLPFSIYSVHHLFFYTPKSLRLLFQKHNFEIEKISTWKSYRRTKSGSFYPGATFIEHYALMLGDLISKSGLFIEIYARRGKERPM